MRSPALLLMALALPAAEPLVLPATGPWDLGWDPLLAAQAEQDLVPGGTLLQAAEPGWWAGAALAGQTADDGGERAWGARRPDHDGVSAAAGLGAAWSAVSVAVRPEWRWARDPAVADQPASVQIVPAGTAVVRLPADLAAVASTEPVGWGPGIFGNLLFTAGDRGFAHARLATARPFAGLELLGDPVFLHAEGLAGRLDAEDGLLDGPGVAAARIAARWRWLGVAASRRWHADWGDLGADAGQVRTSIEAALDTGRVRLAAAIGLDPMAAPDGDDPLPLLIVLDGYDLADDGSRRLALEWHHGEAAGGGDSAYLRTWVPDPAPPAAGGVDAVRALWSHRIGDSDWRYDLSPGWLQLRREGTEPSERIRLDARIAVAAGRAVADLGLWGAWWHRRDGDDGSSMDLGAATGLAWGF